MCGICGIVGFCGAPVDLDRLKTMTDILAHRGPDDSGIYHKDGVGLGHRRLSIIDLSPSGHQPMANEDRSIWITYNGEIYNFRELKGELEKAGHRFVSNSDTEVIIHGFEEWGEACWERLDGMFAFALWDSINRRLFLVRDPFGVKPLFYWYKSGRVVFASEIKSVLASGLVERRVCQRSLSNFLTYFYTPGPETIIEDVCHVKPGRSLCFSATGIKEKRFWTLRVDDSLEKLSEEELYEMIRCECKAAVRKSLVADVPVGLLLSSGIDSNIILNEMLEIGCPDTRTYTTGFGDRSYDESRLVNAVTTKLGVHNEMSREDEQNIPEMFDHMVFHLDSLNANLGNLAEYCYFKNAARNTKVALVGAGNDELFAGYSTYIADRLRRYYMLFPGFMRSLTRSCVSLIPESERKYSYGYLLRKFTEGADFEREKAHYWWRTIFTDDDKRRLFPGSDEGEGFRTDSFYIYDAFYKEAGKTLGFEDQSLYADFFGFNTENANIEVDNLSMAFSLEVRPPFLTRRFVEFAFKIPFWMKRRGTKTKYCLRKAYEHRLPKQVVWQKKHGLISPLSRLIRGQLREMVCDSLTERGDHPYFNYKYINTILDEHLAGRRDHGYHLYVLFTFMRWFDIHIKT